VLNGPAVNALEAREIPGMEEEQEPVVHDLHEHAATD